MTRLKIGVRLESFNLPLRRALQEAEKLGVTGVQVNALGDLSPRALSQTGRKEFRHLLRSHNMELTALGCPLRHGLDSPEGQEGRIDHIRGVMSLSFDLEARIVVVQAGRIPEDPETPQSFNLSEAVLALGRHGDRIGAHLALETGLEAGKTMAAFLKRFDSGGLGVNLNPTNLLLHGFDPYESTRDLRGLLVHCHAKDGRTAGTSQAGQEVPLGHGDIDWLLFLSTLEEVEYRGWLTVERETGENRLADIAAGVSFLRRLVG